MHKNTDMNNLSLPELIIGTMRLGAWGSKMSSNELEIFINGCIDLGLNAFDHADIYGDYTTESDFGKVLKNNSSLRANVKLITKCGINKVCDIRPEYKVPSYDCSAGHIKASVEASLKNFNTDYIDLLLLHRPDYLMQPDEVAECFTKLKKDGKVCYFGVSNFSTSQFDLLNKSFQLTTNQIEVSLFHLDALDNGSLDQCMVHGIRPMAWSPLGGGSLFGTTLTEANKRILKVADGLCDVYSCTIDQLLFAWLLSHPSGILPVTGTSKLDRIVAAQKALSIKLAREDWYLLLQAAKGNQIP